MGPLLGSDTACSLKKAFQHLPVGYDQVNTHHFVFLFLVCDADMLHCPPLKCLSRNSYIKIVFLAILMQYIFKQSISLNLEVGYIPIIQLLPMS